MCMVLEIWKTCTQDNFITRWHYPKGKWFSFDKYVFYIFLTFMPYLVYSLFFFITLISFYSLCETKWKLLWRLLNYSPDLGFDKCAIYCTKNVGHSCHFEKNPSYSSYCISSSVLGKWILFSFWQSDVSIASIEV